MSNVVFASQYAAIEAALGFKPAVLREYLEKYSGVENTFETLRNDSLHSEAIHVFFDKALESLSQLDPDHTILVRERNEFPPQLKTWANYTEVLYVKGSVSVLKMNAVSVVGSRAATVDGRLRASRIAKILCDNDYCVASGLALGIDTAAHTGALRYRGKTFAVIGTPINKYYPKENKELQDLISTYGAVVSQFSPLRPTQKLNFPLRNELMSALTLATVIVEASETSGALTQARYCLRQNKRLFIMQNQIDKSELSWPKEYLKKGAVALKSVEDLLENLNSPPAEKKRQHQLKLL